MKGVDTTFLIGILRKDAGAIAKAIELDGEPLVFTTEANVYEVVTGISKSINVKAAMKDFETLLDRLIVLPVDHKAAIKSGLISRDLLLKGQMIDDIDCIIA